MFTGLLDTDGRNINNMGLFDALSGRIGHFNSIAVPVHNNIFAKIKELPNGDDKKLFAASLMIAEQGIDLFFKPSEGLVTKDVKQYSKRDIEKLYAVFMIWTFYDLCHPATNFFKQKKLQKNTLEHILEINKDEFKHYFNVLKHDYTFIGPWQLDELWEETIRIIRTTPDTHENHFIFAKKFKNISVTIGLSLAQ